MLLLPVLLNQSLLSLMLFPEQFVAILLKFRVSFTSSQLFSVFDALSVGLSDSHCQFLVGGVELLLAFGEFFAATGQFRLSIRFMVVEIRVSFAKVGVVVFKSGDMLTEVGVVRLKPRDLSSGDLHISLVLVLEGLLVALLDPVIDGNLLMQVCLYDVFGLSLLLQVLSKVLYFDGLL